MIEPLPLVSVLMPVRNGERWLATAIDSLLAQTLRDIEILIVDDGSTDNTPAILKDYSARDQRIRVIRKDSLGIVAALNRGLEEARAPLTARLDADDVALPERLQRQWEYMRSNTKVGLLGSWAERISASGQPTGWLKPPTDPKALAEVLPLTNPMIHSSVIIRTNLVRKLGGYREAFRGAEDYDLWLRISEAADVANLPECLIRYRRHADSVTAQQGMRQAFSVRLAQRAMRSRRVGEPDPAVQLTTPPDWRSATADTSFYADDASLYRALDLADMSNPWNPSFDAADLKPILHSEPSLNHKERTFAALAIARHLRNAHWYHSRTTVRVLLQLAAARPKVALKAAWHAVTMRAPFAA